MELHRENYKYSVQRFENVGFMFLYQSKVKLLQSYLTCNSFFELFYFPSAIWKHKNCSISEGEYEDRVTIASTASEYPLAIFGFREPPAPKHENCLLG